MCSAKRLRGRPATGRRGCGGRRFVGRRAAQLGRDQGRGKAAAGKSAKPCRSAITARCVPRALPALAEAAKLGSKARQGGFDWPHWRDLLPKLAEETAELEAEAARRSGEQAAVEAELGDLLFTVVNLGRHLRRGCGDGAARMQSAFSAAFQEDGDRGSRARSKSLSPAELEELWAQRRKQDAAGAQRSRHVIVIRTAQDFDELEACVQLQVETWGYDADRRDSAQGVSGDAEDRRPGDSAPSTPRLPGPSAASSWSDLPCLCRE